MAEISLNQKIRTFLNQALGLLDRKKYGHALEKLLKAEELDRENPEILYNLGVTFSRMEDYGRAVDYLRKVKALPTAFVDILTVNRLLAYSLIMRKSHEEAHEVIDESLRLSAADTTLLNMKGYLLEQEGKLSEAADVFEAIIEIDSENSNACNSLAYVLARMEKGDHSKALKYAKKAFDANPDNPAYCDTLGYVYMVKGQPDFAKKFMKKALSLMPDSIEIRQHINELLQLDK